MVSPLATVSDITIPDPGSHTARDVLSRAMGRLLRDLLALPRSMPARDPGADALWGAIRRIAAGGASPGAAALMSALRSPTVGALLRTVRNAITPGARTPGASFDRAQIEAVVAELVATLALELAIAGVLGDEVRLTRLPLRLLSLSARARIDLPRGASAAVFTDGLLSIEIDRGADRMSLDLGAIARGEHVDGATIERPYHPIERDLPLAIADNNPRAAFGADPGEPGNPVSLGDHPADEWTAMLRECLGIIRRSLPDLASEIDLVVRQILPVGFHAETHRSASYRESVGAIYMTLHPLVMTMTEAVIHEFSHNKLHTLLELDPILENDAEARFTSPVRRDLRPMRGVLLAVHAYVPVAHLYERMIEQQHSFTKSPYFHERFAQIRAMNREGAAVLFAHARPTAIGEGVLGELGRWIDHFKD